MPEASIIQLLDHARSHAVVHAKRDVFAFLEVRFWNLPTPASWRRDAGDHAPEAIAARAAGRRRRGCACAWGSARRAIGCARMNDQNCDSVSLTERTPKGCARRDHRPAGARARGGRRRAWCAGTSNAGANDENPALWVPGAPVETSCGSASRAEKQQAQMVGSRPTRPAPVNTRRCHGGAPPRRWRESPRKSPPGRARSVPRTAPQDAVALRKACTVRPRIACPHGPGRGDVGSGGTARGRYPR